MTVTDVLASHGRDRDSPARTPRAAPSVIVVMAIAIALLLATGVTAVVRLSGGGPQPEDALPSSTFAFAKLDLDPAASQKLAVRALARRFEDAPGESLRELRDAVVRGLVEPLGLDYGEDVRPWLGDRYAAAGFVADGDAQPLVAVQVTDEAAARRAVETAQTQSRPGLAFLRGYALIAPTQELADEAARQADREPLSDREDFADDIGLLTGDQVAVGWADNERLYDLVFADVVTALEMDAAARDPRSAVGGRTVLGVHATARFVEVESLVVGADRSGLSPPADASGGADLLESLPRDTAAALLVTDAASFQGSTAAVGGLAAVGGGGLLALGLGGVDPREWSGPLGDVFDALAPVGPELRSQLLPLLRGATVLALGPLPGGTSSRSDASLLLVAEVAAPGNAATPLRRARDVLRRAGLTSEVAVRGRRVHAAVGSAYAGDVGVPGDLGKTALFRTAMGSLDDEVTTAAYVDLASVARSDPGFPAGLRPVTAIGVSGRATEAGSVLRVRIVIG